MLRQVVAHARTTGDTFSLTMALADLGLLRALQGEIDEGIAILEEDRDLLERRHLPWTGIELQVHGILSTVYLMAGRDDEARAVGERAVELSRELRPSLTDFYDAGSVADLAAAMQGLGDDAQANALIDEALSIVEGAGTWMEGSVKDAAARMALARGEREEAARLAGESLAISGRIGNHYWMNGTVYALETLGLALDDPQQAARLLAAVDALLAKASHVRAPARRPAYDAATVRLREELGDEAFEAAVAEGGQLSLDAAVEYARRGQGRRRRPSSGWGSLTPTENEVVKLVAQGLSNPKIAERMFISKKTVTTHLTHVFAKLGMSSRAELSAEAARRGM